MIPLDTFQIESQYKDKRQEPLHQSTQRHRRFTNVTKITYLVIHLTSVDRRV